MDSALSETPAPARPAVPLRRRIRPVWWVAATLVALTLIALSPMWINDMRLDGLVDRVRSYPLPPGTEPNIAIQGKVGLQVGDSNHCDYVVRLSLRTTLPAAALIKYYETTTIRGVNGAPLSGEVYFAQGKGPRPVIVEFLELHDAGLDLRCR
ncbi:hypothetical protein [Nonomuraea typhae]|uniref:hypothetical protein n=1 Tax=Nonomuraea typhae TaxID=2603600 RepID=UPI0012F71E6A|nr:hypothetical protein [Nonomuraea typhae]